jgi:very-short-patch-repair endonuclease
MDLKTEYIIKQLGRTKNKKYEMYVVNRIINLINDFDIKFITQQYVSRPNGFALTDLYFPQFEIHIEVDEPHHKKNIIPDKIRESDIVNATGCSDPIRINVDKTILEINNQIDNVVKKICELKQKQQSSFVAWDIEAEFNPDTYINLGYIDIKDNVAFHTIADGCNCFGHNYKGYQRAGAKHTRYTDIGLWFPKLYSNKDWNNYENSDQTIITEEPKTEKYINFTKKYLENIDNELSKQIVFARVKDNLGNILYRFRGMYELDKEQSINSYSLVWNRIETRVETFKYNQNNA